MYFNVNVKDKSCVILGILNYLKNALIGNFATKTFCSTNNIKRLQFSLYISMLLF